MKKVYIELNENLVNKLSVRNTNNEYQIELKNHRGITLIALIITIIIMLILVGVTVNVSLQGGLFNKAREATKQTQKEIDKEQLQVAVWDSYNNQGNLDLDKLKDNLPEGFSEKEGTYESEKGNLFIIENGMVKDVKWTQDEKGNILYEEKESGIKIGDYVNYENILQTNPVTVNENTQVIKDLQEYSGLKEAKINGVTTEYNSKSQISQETDLKWKVLDVKNGNLRLISEKPTKSKVYLYEYNGYNNAVYLLDEVCSTLYSTSKGTAQNLKIEDIEDKTKYDYTQYENSYVETGKYGGTKEYTDDGCRYYPEIFAKEKKGWVDDKQGTEYDLGEQNKLINQTEAKKAESKIKITQTYWYREMQKNDWKNETYQNIFIKDVTNNTTSNYDRYWLSSRCMIANSSLADFRVHDVEIGSVGAYSLYNSKNGHNGIAYPVRPVVSLSSDIQINKEKVGDTWQIVK